MIEAILTKSPNKTKKYKVIVSDGNTVKTIHFGAAGYDDYTTHGDDERKQRYIKRHKVTEDWNNPFTAGFWSRYTLWNKKTITASLADIRNRYNIKIQNLI